MGAKQKALCVATRCTTAQQFIETFHRFCDEQSFFVATMNMRPVGLETPFSIQLADKTPVLQGLCVVLAAWTTGNNPHKRPGIRLGIRRLTADSEAIFYQLQAMRTGTPQEAVTEAVDLPDIPPLPVAAEATRPTPPPVPPRPPPVPVAAQPAVEEQRTPGSELVLPANPLSTLTDGSIEGFVDCTLYEETANFFRAPEDDDDDDEPAPPPKPEIVEALPEFRPSAVIAAAFNDDTNATVTVAEPVTQAPSPVTPIDASVVASLARVEQSMNKLVETLDTSRPIDELPRETPVPAGEAYARQVAKRAARHRSKWLVIAGATAIATAAAIGLWITRSAAGEQPAAPPQVAKAPVEPEPAAAKPIEPPVAEPPPPPVEDKPEPEPEVDDEVDGDELAAEPGTPVAGEGPCKLEVTATPAGTMVKIDGKQIGPSPLTIAGPCTRTRVDLVHPRYQAEQRWVTPMPDKPGKVDVTLVRPTHTLSVITKPAGAKISIAGRRAGTSPTKVQLMGFSGLEVKIEKPGFQTVTKRIYSKKKADSLSVTLKRSLWIK